MSFGKDGALRVISVIGLFLKNANGCYREDKMGRYWSWRERTRKVEEESKKGGEEEMEKMSKWRESG